MFNVKGMRLDLKSDASVYLSTSPRLRIENDGLGLRV